MTDAATLVNDAETALVPTPNADELPRRLSTFATFGDALDYAAKGKRGLNFHDPRGTLKRVYPYSELREDALDMAYRLIAHGVGKGDRVALIAETGPEFAALFCGYGFAWVGHFFFEKNRPATFKHPFYSFAGDWVMFKDILIGKIRF